jgi:hypothetical protein
MNKRGASVIEYIVLIVLILSALYVMKDMMSRGIFSKYKQTGESFGFGRQYDAKRTMVCKEDPLSCGAKYILGRRAINANSRILYDEDCYQGKVRRTPAPINNGSGWNTDTGGCPQCSPGDDSCFCCEDDIKQQCKVSACNG